MARLMPPKAILARSRSYVQTHLVAAISPVLWCRRLAARPRRCGRSGCSAWYWGLADSIGRRNTSNSEVFVGRPAGKLEELIGRDAGALRRLPRFLLWRSVSCGHKLRRDSRAKRPQKRLGVSPTSDTRWFRHCGGFALVKAKPICGWSLCLAAREEVGLLRAQAVGVREIACRVGRSPSTVS